MIFVTMDIDLQPALMAFNNGIKCSFKTIYRAPTKCQALCSILNRNGYSCRVCLLGRGFTIIVHTGGTLYRNKHIERKIPRLVGVSNREN